MVNTYLPIFRGLDARGGRKLRTDTHTHTHGTTTVTLTTHARRGLIITPPPLLQPTPAHYSSLRLMSLGTWWILRPAMSSLSLGASPLHCHTPGCTRALRSSQQPLLPLPLHCHTPHHTHTQIKTHPHTTTDRTFRIQFYNNYNTR